jgi:mRNA-degrading endonuclease RelE of RelBE toxin-antitoxin system
MVVARLALAKTFLESYSLLPKAQQKKVRELVERVQEDPTRTGLNFERLEGVKDPRARSLRVDQAYRVIVVQPERGDVLLCVWVDHHDEAYRWVARKTFEVNPVSGALQVFSVEEGREALAEVPAPLTPKKKAAAARLFEKFDDEELILGGVPAVLLASVREVVTEAQLDLLAPHLPSDAADMLFLLAAGYSFHEALEEASRPKELVPAIDVEDFQAALERPMSQESFHLVEGEDELERILEAPLEKWRIFLHPSQRRLVAQSFNGPVRVLGGAGTGKTVVLMHRAKHLAERVFTDKDDRILVTTFTRNLALDLEASLRSLTPSGIDRIEVKNLHAWARSFYEQQVGARVLVLEGDEAREALMTEAATVASTDRFTVAFYLDEWDQVVQDQEAESKEAYFRARRTGRGTRLSRADRAEIWKVLSRYRELMREHGQVEWSDIVREARLRLESGKVRLPYRAVLADEVQDFSSPELRLLRAMVPPGPNDLFLVGDAHQRIYGQMTRLGPCGIEIRGRSRRLRLNYRTTEQIRARAVAILENLEIDDLDGGVDKLTGYRSLRRGPAPDIHLMERPEDEQKLILATLKRWLESTPSGDICVAARTNRLVDRYGEMLKAADHKVVKLKGDASPSGPGIRVATMHRLKGLEFKKVLLAGVQKGEVPLALPDSTFPDPSARADHEQRERCLIYVAATRARDELMVTGFGMSSPLIGEAVGGV